jgi:hypothetical protein
MSGFTVTGLTTYVAENADRILAASITGAETLKVPGISIQAGIKNAEKIMLFSNTAPFQVGGTCAFNASGTTAFTNVTLTVSPLKWNDTFCPEDLQIKYTSTKLVAGSNYETLPFEELIMKNVTDNIAFQLEKTIWQGDTTLTNLNDLKQLDGWLKKIDAGSPISATPTADITTGNIIGIMDDIYTKIPAALLNNAEKPLTAFMGWDTFRLLMIAEKNSNKFHFNPGEAHATGEYTMPGSGLKCKAVHGLDAIAGSLASYTDRIICTYPANLFYGTDLANEYEEAKLWYSLDDQNIKGSIKWKSGCQVAYTTEVVEYSNS